MNPFKRPEDDDKKSFSKPIVSDQRPGAIDPRAQQLDIFPLDAWEFDDPKKVAVPVVRLKSPWQFSVQSDIDGLISNIGDMNNKNKITPSEKKEIYRQWQVMIEAKNGIDIGVEQAGISIFDATYLAFTTAHNNLLGYLYTSPGILLDYTVSSTVDFEIFVALWGTWKSKESDVQSMINAWQLVKGSENALAGTTTVPVPPTLAGNIMFNTAYLRWDIQSNLTGTETIRIERSDSSDFAPHIDVATVSGSSYTEEGLILNGTNDTPAPRTYYYRVVRIVNETIFSVPSNVISLTAESLSPKAIAANAITNAKVATDAITADKIFANSITSDKIAASSVIAEKISVANLSSINSDLGTISAGKLFTTGDSQTIPQKSFIDMNEGSMRMGTPTVGIEYDGVENTFSIRGVDMELTESDLTTYKYTGVDKLSLSHEEISLMVRNVNQERLAGILYDVNRKTFKFTQSPYVPLQGTWVEKSITPGVSVYDSYSLIQQQNGELSQLFEVFTNPGYSVYEIKANTSGVWGSSSLVATGMYASHIQRKDGVIHCVMQKGSPVNGYYEMTRSQAGTWGSESLILAQNGGACSLIEKSDGTLHLIFVDGVDGKIYEITKSVGGVWSSKSIVLNESLDVRKISFIQQQDGSLMLVFSAYSNGTVYEMSRPVGGNWSGKTVVSTGSAPSLIQQENRKLHLIMFSGAIREFSRFPSESSWTVSAISVTGCSSSAHIQRQDGALHGIFKDPSGSSYFKEITCELYAKAGGGFIARGASDYTLFDGAKITIPGGTIATYTGPVGPPGDKGAKGDTGNTGLAATVAVGTVVAGTTPLDAHVTNSGTSGAAVLDFVVPKGEPGTTVPDISGLTTIDEVDRANDQLIIYDASTLSHKKVSPENFGASNTINITEGETIANYLPCYIAADGKSYIATKNDIAKCIVAGIKSVAGKLQTSGVITNGSWAWTPGLTCYLGNNGAIIQDVDLISSIYSEATTVIGKAISATSIDINIESPVINGEGQFDKNVYAKYVVTADTQAINNTNPTVLYQTQIEDTHNAYNPATGEYTIKVDGYYHINAKLLLSLTTGTNTCELQLIKNDVWFQTLYYSNSDNTGAAVYRSVSGSATIKLLVGDKIRFNCYNVIPTSVYSGGGYARYSWFDIQLIVGQIATWTGDSIVESGSNSSGRFVKFSDGTLEQWGNTTRAFSAGGSAQSASGYLFPIPFFDNLIGLSASIVVDTNWGGVTMYTMSADSVSSYSIIILNTTYTNTITWKWHAIGRWKA